MRLTTQATPRLVARAMFARRSYVLLWQRVQVNAPWRRTFWTSDARLARQAERHDALQKVRELAPLIGLLRARDLHTVVEIGSDRGGTFFAWCQLAEPDAVLISIDLPASNTDEDRLPAYGAPGQSLFFTRGDSHAAATRDKLARILGDRRIDFLMIDGDHTYDGVRADYELYHSLVASDGCIAFHDVIPHTTDPACKVDVFWDELKQNRAHVEFVDPGDDRGLGSWGGIGVLFGPFARDPVAPALAR